jgi:WD40 repeat protein
MSLRKRRTLLVAGLLAVILFTALISRLLPRGNPPGGDQDRDRTLTGHSFPVQALVFHPDGATLTSAAAYFSGTAPRLEVTDWNVATGQPGTKHPLPHQAVSCLSFAPGGRMLAVNGADQGTWLWDLAGPHEARRLEDYRSIVCALAFSRDGSQLATSDFEYGVTLWDVDGGRPRTRCQGTVYALAFAPDGQMLAGGGPDHTVRLWDVATGEERGTLQGHARPVQALAFAPDGRALAAGDWRGVVKLWDVASRTERATLAASDDKVIFEEVSAVTFAPDGGTLAVAIGRAVQLWDVTTGRLVARLEGHEGKVQCLAYAPDGTRLASGGHDRAVRLWDVASVLRQRPDK